jgi:hypothetical protein
LRFTVRRNAAEALNRARARIISRERESIAFRLRICGISIQQAAQIPRGSIQIVVRREWVNAESGGRSRHQLPETASADRRNCEWMPRRLGRNKRNEQPWIQSVKERFNANAIGERAALKR